MKWHLYGKKTAFKVIIDLALYQSFQLQQMALNIFFFYYLFISSKHLNIQIKGIFFFIKCLLVFGYQHDLIYKVELLYVCKSVTLPVSGTELCEICCASVACGIGFVYILVYFSNMAKQAWNYMLNGTADSKG